MKSHAPVGFPYLVLSVNRSVNLWCRRREGQCAARVRYLTIARRYCRSNFLFADDPLGANGKRAVYRSLSALSQTQCPGLATESMIP